MRGASPETNPDRSRWAWWDLLLLLTAGAILVYQLILPPVVGLADNGDFARILGPLGLRPLTNDRDLLYFQYINTKYLMDHPFWHSGYRSSETVLAAVVRVVASGLSKSPLFDVRLLGALHAALLLVAIGLMLRAGRRLVPPARVGLGVLFVFVFTDVAYVAPFNSFYSATASSLSLLLLAGVVASVAARPEANPRLVFWYWLAAAAFVTSKPQEAVLAPLLALFGVRITGVSGRGRARQTAWMWAAALCGLAAWSFSGAPASFKQAGVYHSIFLEILPHSSTPEEDLAALGLPTDWVRYAGTSAYQPGSLLKEPRLRAMFAEHAGFRDIVGFYVSHPQRLSSLMARSAHAAMHMRPRHLGNFEKGNGPGPRGLSRAFSAWSGLKERLEPAGPWFFAILLFSNVLGALLVHRRSGSTGVRLIAEGILLLTVMAAAEFAAGTLADTLSDLVRHLYTFHVMVDLCVIADVVWVIAALSSRASRQAESATGKSRRREAVALG